MAVPENLDQRTLETPKRSDVAHVMAKNATANFSRLGMMWGITLVLPPILVRVLDKPVFASWMLILQLGLYITMLDSGLQSAVARFVARADADPDRSHMARVMSSSLAVLTMTGALLALGVTLVAMAERRFFPSIPAAIAGDARVALLVVGLSLAFCLPFSTLAGFFWGIQRNEINAFVGAAGKFAGAVGTGWAAYTGHGLVAMAGWTAAGNVLQCVLFTVAWKKIGVAEMTRRAAVKLAAIKELAVFSSATMVSQLSSLLITGMDLPIVAMFDFRSAPYYAIAATVSNIIVAPQGAVLAAFMPVAAGMSVSRTPEQIGGVLVRATRYSTALVFLIAMPIVLGMYPLLALWVGRDYAQHTVSFGMVLVIGQMIRLTLAPYSMIAFSLGQQQRTLYSPLIEGVVNLACSVFGAYKFGAIGVAVGTLIGAVVGIAIHLLVSIPKTDAIRVSRVRLVMEGIVRPMRGVVPPVVLWLVFHFLVQNVTARALATVAAVILAYVLVLLTSFTADERQEMVRIVTRLTTAPFRRTANAAR